MSGMRVRVAWVLPGQGSLRGGCLTAATATDGRPELDGLAAAATHAVDRIARATDLDVRALADDPGAGARTAHAQPTILAASLAAAAALEAAGLRPDVVAGHSLGECTAAVVAGALSVEDGARVVAARGAAMARACAATPGAMAAVVKLAPSTLEAVLTEVDGVVVANDNAPGQVVVAGPPDAVTSLRGPVRDAGGRLVPLAVEGAFHSPAMAPAVAAMTAAVSDARLTTPEVPLVTGTTAQSLGTAAEIGRALVDGILATVRWREVQRTLADGGVTHLVEVGPGGVLAGLARRTLPDIEVRTVATPADAHALAAELGVLVGTR